MITEFLLARIAEDEATASAAVIPAHDAPNAHHPHPELARWRYAPWSPGTSGEVEYDYDSPHRYDSTSYVTCDSEGITPAVAENVGPHIARWDPAQVLAECAAKRRIIARHAPIEFEDAPGEYACAVTPSHGFWPCPDLRDLAAVHADHPDYRQEYCS